MKQALCAIAICAAVFCYCAPATAQTVVASEDFDGGAVNLTSGFTAADNLDGGGGDWYGIGSLNAWPQVDTNGDPSPPFGLVDTSTTTFPGDTEGILSDAASDKDNILFVLSDTREWTDDVNGDPNNPLINSWVFDISSATGPMRLNIDMGQQSDGGSFGGFNEASIQFEYSIDGGAFQPAMSLDSFDATGAYTFRNMDDAANYAAVFVAQATGPGTIVKTSVETGSPVADAILDKCPPDGGTNAGLLDTFSTDIVGSGSSLELRMTAYVSFEVLAFDNIEITEAGSMGGAVTPTSFDVVNGQLNTGGVAELAQSDNQDLSVFRDQLSLSSTITIDFKSTSPVAMPTSLEFTYEASVFARPNILQTLSLFNYVTGAYEEVDQRNAMKNVDSVVVVNASGDLSRFVEPGTGCIEARARYTVGNPRANYSVNTDNVVWNIE